MQTHTMIICACPRLLKRQQCAEIVKDSLVVHRLMLMGLGSGASPLDHKARAIARSLYAETQTLPALRVILSQITSVTSDMGVELGLADMNGLPLKEIVPDWISDTESALNLDCEDVQAVQVPRLLDDASADFEELFLPRALAVPGLNHIINNMCSDCNRELQSWPDWLPQFRQVVALLHHGHLRRQYIATCLRGTRHAWVENLFEKGVDQFAEWRWGSTVSVLTVLMPLQKYLQVSWDPDKFNALGERGVEEDAAAEAARGQADVNALTHAIRSNMFWSYGSLILMLNSVSTRFASWAEGCACHPFGAKIKSKKATPDVNIDALAALDCCRKELGLPASSDGRAFLPCPLAGLRASELASGGVEQLVSDMVALSKEELLMNLVHLTEEETGELLQEFERGKGHILASVSNKLQNWKMLPWRLAALNDLDETRAREAAKSCLLEFDEADQQPELHHRMTWYWMKTSPTFRAELEAFISGESLCALPLLKRTVWEMAFIPIAGASAFATFAVRLT